MLFRCRGTHSTCRRSTPYTNVRLLRQNEQWSASWARFPSPGAQNIGIVPSLEAALGNIEPSLPDHISPGLGRTPGTAAFWVICAPIIFPVIALSTLPALFTVIGLSLEPSATGWLVICLAGACQFAGISLWAAHVGAGAFAGPVKVRPGWIWIAIVLGPPLLFVPALLASLLFGDDPSWQFSSETDPSLFAPDNWSAAYLFYALLLAPVLEEITFRGVALGALMSRGMTAGPAMLLSSLGFAFVHMQYSLPAMAVVFFTGLGFAGLRLLSRSILVPILAHMAANAAMILMQILATAPPA